MPTLFVTIAGNIGVGKSSLVALLSRKLGWEPVFEAVEDNPYLADFYEDMNRWSFHSQVYFLVRRLKQHHDLLQQPNAVLQDRSVYEDAEIFARNLFRQGHLSERDWLSYYELYQTLAHLLKPPDLVIYLRASMPTLRRRIAGRGREYERNIADSYLQDLNQLYNEWVSNFRLSPVLTVDTDNLDYVQYDEHLEQIWSRIADRLHGRDYLSLQ
ncbi:MAG: deoxynucleoside kinase [Candidatus Promineofilum sp.]|nr:deoxynucleoside kinase [Promineifilum sp.]